MRTALLVPLVVGTLACPAPVTVDGGFPNGTDGGSVLGADGGSTTLDPLDAGPEPTSPLQAVAGELTIFQLDLPAGITASIGESAIVVGPDGTTVLIDVGNGSHDDDVRAALLALNTVDLIPSRGFAARGPFDVDWVVLTHFHGDHIGGLRDLLSGPQAVTVKKGIVHRGFVDLGPGAAEADVDAVCQLLRTSAFSPLDAPLCVAAAPAPCSGWVGQYPAVDCPGLRGPPLTLGAGAELAFLFADARTADFAAPAFPDDTTNQENARSVAGEIRFGAFRFHFAGDLTGAGTTGEPDLESVLVGHHDYGALGVDVVHVNHHARNTSSNAAFTAALAPFDGRSRNAVAGINAAYLGSPQAEPLAAWLDQGRLGEGLLWATATTVGSATHAGLVDARGKVIVQTVQHGAGYRIQAAGPALRSRAFPSVRR